ncbi:hypothetical protein B0H13DRAFT_1911229 [Mycena leptocephala]|nr:hypothetical protein B0H13DRAFT_1911229 [Mycena leptocephala]
MASSTPSQTNGGANSMMGSAKEMLTPVQVGGAVGSDSMQRDGKEQHAKGETEKTAAQTADAADGWMNQMAGTANKVIGQVMGDKTKEASGKAQETAGQAKKEANKPV